MKMVAIEKPAGHGRLWDHLYKHNKNLIKLEEDVAVYSGPVNLVCTKAFPWL